jgi:glycosyltransferase involved in cell wall biosynthesis
VHTIRNGADLAAFDPATPADPYLRAGLGARPHDCLVLYAGTHGIPQGLPEATQAATRLIGRPIRLAFVGEGADKQRLRHQVSELALTNVTLANGIPADMMPGLLASADILLVTLRDIPLLAASIPSKIFEYLAAGRPVIGAVAGEAAQILREAGAIVVPPGDSVALATAIRKLAADAEVRAIIAAQGRAYVERFFDRAELAREYRKILVAPGSRRIELAAQAAGRQR